MKSHNLVSKGFFVLVVALFFTSVFSANAATNLNIDGAQKFQTMDGFGVNANSLSWNNGELEPAIDMLADEMGSTLWRVVFDMEDWEITNDNSDPTVFNWDYYNGVYSSPKFQNLWGTIGYLNQKGIFSEIMLSLMGRVPNWMDSVNHNGSKIGAASEDEWVEMVASLLYYARNTMHLSFSMLDPLNEPDWNGYEGPQVDQYQYARLLNKLSQKLDSIGLNDIRLVGPTTASIDTGNVINNLGTVFSINLVQKASNITSSAQNLATTLPSPVTAGNLIVVSVSGWPNLPASTAVTDSLGNSYSIAGNVLTTQGAYSAIYYARNVKGGTDTVTFRTVASGGQISMTVAEFTGVDSNSPVDAVAGATGSGSIPSSGAMTPSVSGDLIIGSGTHNGNTTTNPGTGFTMIAVPTEDSVSHQPLAMEYQILNGPQAASATFNLSTGFGWTQNGVLFKPAVPLVPDTTPPVVPNNLTETPYSSSQINLSWAASTDPIIIGQATSGVAGYQVFRGIGTGAPALIATTTATTYPDTGLQASTTYSYTVDAFDVVGNVSAQSSPVQGTTLPIDTTAPSVPGNLSATAVSATQINLSWSASTDNVGVAGYQIFRNGILVSTSTSTSYSDTGLTAGTTYTYTVEAVDTSGNISAPSSPASATTTTFAFEDEFGGSALDTTQWVAMNRPGDSSNNEVQYYLPTNVSESGGYLNITSQADTSVPGYSYTSEMVQWKSFNFTYGTVEFRAKMAGGQGTWPAVWMLGYNCQQTNVTTPDNVPPCNWPNPGSNEIDIVETTGNDPTHTNQGVDSGSGWQACTPSMTDASQNWHTYDLIWAPGSLTWQIDGVTTCHITSSVPSTPMFLIVNTAMGGYGGTINSSTLPQTLSLDYVRVTSYDTIAPTVPTGLTATAVSSSQINLSWSASTDNIGVAGYKVFRKGLQVATVTGTTYNDTGLSPSTLYSYTVSAYDASGNTSGQSSPASAITLAPDTSPPTVTAFTIPATANTLIIAIGSFIATDNIGVTGYLVTESATPPLPMAGVWSATAPISYTFATAGSKTLYAWAKDASGNVSASRSASVTITLPDTTPPAVTAFTIPATANTLIIAIGSFIATDNIGVTGYLVNESPSTPSASGGGWSTTAPTSYPFTTAGSKTLYAWAKDAAGNVSASRSANITIDTTPPAVTAFTIPATANTLTIAIGSFIATDNIGVTGYLVTESATPPSPTASGWTATAPTSYTFTTAGSKTLYAWAKDAAGNVSASRSANITIDTTPPAVTAFTIPATANTLTIAIGSFIATDNIGVTGYLVTESATPPSPTASGWTATAPTSYTFTTAGSKTLYARAKDAAGNVSASRSASVTITLLDSTPPSAPTNLTAIASGPTQVNLNWTASTDNVGVAGYRIMRNGSQIAASISTNYSDTTVAAGTTYNYTVRAYDAAGNVSADSTTASVTTPTVPLTPVLDKAVSTKQASGSSSISSPSISTAQPNELLVAFIGSDGPNSGGSQRITTVTGGGLTWTLRSRANAQAGTAEIWVAAATNVVTNVIVTATRVTGSYQGMITVAAFQGASLTVNGAAANASASSGAPRVSLTTTHANSLVWSVGDDWDRAVARTVSANQTKFSEYLAPAGDTFWVQYVTAPSAAAGVTATISCSAPTTDRWNFAAIEILPQ